MVLKPGLTCLFWTRKFVGDKKDLPFAQLNEMRLYRTAKAVVFVHNNIITFTLESKRTDV